MKTLEIPSPIDGHVHFRRNEMMENVIAHTASCFSAAIVMPNTRTPDITDAATLKRYCQEIKRALPIESRFIPLMTIKLLPTTTWETIAQAKIAGVIAAKAYPKAVTTGSEDGISNYHDLYPIFAEMERCGVVLSLHCEMWNTPILESERAFLPIVADIALTFPSLKIVFEHVTTIEGVRLVRRHPNMAATITPQDMLLTWEDILAPDKKTPINPHNYHKSCSNTEEDRLALVGAATSGNPQFFFGSDSAPHPRELKECASPKPGVFSAPVALPFLTMIFETVGALDKLEAFVSTNIREFYGLDKILARGPTPCAKITQLVKEPWRVPDEYNGIVPFLAGETITWKIVG